MGVYAVGMLSQHHAIGLQTDCMVTVLAPVVEAARVPCVCPMALGYGLPQLLLECRQAVLQMGLCSP